MDRQESVKGSWPVAPSSYLEPRTCKLIILETCRHHCITLRGIAPEDSLSSLELLFPGQFVQVEYVIALGGGDTQELLDCRLEATGNAAFKIVNNERQNNVFVIEAAVRRVLTADAGQGIERHALVANLLVDHPGPLPLVQTSSVHCGGNALPSYTGKFTFLLPADVPGTFRIKFKFKSHGRINDSCGEEVIDEKRTFVVTHYPYRKNLSDYWYGHSLPTVEKPLTKKQLVGVVASRRSQKIIQYFQDLVENGAFDCFKRDQRRLLQKTDSRDIYFKDLILVIQLEESLLSYQMGNLEECRRLNKDVCTQAGRFNSTNYNVIVGRAKYGLSCAYRQQRRFTEAEEELESSTELLESVVPGMETAINRTCVAALFSEKAAVVRITKSEKKRMKKAMTDVSVHYRHQLGRSPNKNARGPRRSLIRSIFYYLHSSRVMATGVLIPVSEKNISLVETFIEQFRRCFLDECPKRDLALFYNALGDFYVRKGDYEQGIRIVSNAVRIARELQLAEDTRGSSDRLRQLYLLSGRMPLEVPEGRMMGAQPFQEPQYETLERYLDELEQI